MDFSSLFNTLSTPTVMVASLIVLSLLISLGNERQRLALDGIRKEVEDWSKNDLRLKRGTMSHETNIQDPAVWLASATSKALGTPVHLTGMDVHEGPTVVSFQDGESGSRMVYSLMEPGLMKRMATRRKKKTDKMNISSHPLKSWNRNIATAQLNILNAGIVFDLELPKAWQSMANEATDSEVLWLYVL